MHMPLRAEHSGDLMDTCYFVFLHRSGVFGSYGNFVPVVL